VPVIIALRRLRQQDQKYKVSLGYISRPHFKTNKMSLDTLADACNPSYSGGRGQENHGSKTALANGLQDSISINKCWA
jgi:hypothetical protein